MAVIPLNSLAQRCPVCSGISVQFAVDWPISLLWTDCPVCRGLRVQFGLENAQAFATGKMNALPNIRCTTLERISFRAWASSR